MSIDAIDNPFPIAYLLKIDKTGIIYSNYVTDWKHLFRTPCK